MIVLINLYLTARRVILAVMLLIGGAHFLWVMVANPRLVECDIGAFLRKRPETDWLRITDGSINLQDATHFQKITRPHDDATEIFVPLLPSDNLESDSVHVVVFTKDEDLLRLYNEIRQLESPEEIARFKANSPVKLIQPRVVNGVIGRGLMNDDDEMRKLRKRDRRLASDCIILEESDGPEGFLVILLPIGIIMLLWEFRPKKKEVARGLPAQTLSTAPPPRLLVGKPAGPRRLITPRSQASGDDKHLIHDVPCPHCSQALGVSSSNQAAILACPACSGQFRVSEPQEGSRTTPGRGQSAQGRPAQEHPGTDSTDSGKSES